MKELGSSGSRLACTSLRFLDTCFPMSPYLASFYQSIDYHSSLLLTWYQASSWTIRSICLFVYLFICLFLHSVSAALGNHWVFLFLYLSLSFHKHFGNWWDDLMVLKWPEKGETRKSNVGRERKTKYHIFYHMWNWDLTHSSWWHQSRSERSHWRGRKPLEGTRWEWMWTGHGDYLMPILLWNPWIHTLTKND